MWSSPLSRRIASACLAIAATAGLGGCAGVLGIPSAPGDAGFQFFVKPVPNGDF
jgi:hypothetical protein